MAAHLGLVCCLLSSGTAFTSLEAGAAELLLRSGFEGETVRSLFNQVNDTINLTFETGRSSDVSILYEKGTYSDRFAKVIDDPTRAGNRVLQYWLKYARIPSGPGKYKGRIQLDFGPDSTEYYQRYRMYLHPDLAVYRSYPKQNTWFMLSEMRFGSASSDPHVFRITVNLAKETGTNKPLVFLVGGSIRTGGTLGDGTWQSVWNQKNTGFQVPTGKWMNVETGYKQGNATQGRFYFSVQPEGDASKTTIFDITNWTYHPSAPQPIPLTSVSPFKLYTSDQIIDHIRNNGRVAQIYWDDLELWQGWPQ